MTDQYSIRLAKTDDALDIMNFIKSYWDENHILAHDKDFFNFQYLQNGNLNFILAFDPQKEIVGILGYIGYAPGNIYQDVSLALWKVIPNLSDPYLGVKLIHFLQDKLMPRNIFCVGISKNIIGIYKYLGFRTGKLDHFAAFNSKCKNFKISKPPKNIKPILINNEFEYRECFSINASQINLDSSNMLTQKTPKKSIDFLINRYEKHPYFKYKFFEAYESKHLMGLVISREVELGFSKALRIIEVFGEEKDITSIVNNFAVILLESDYEYIDIYASGVDKKEMLTGSYEYISKDKQIVVPDYFDPFEKKNIDILYMTSIEEDVFLFKGDGDQDRPTRKII